MNLKKKIIGFLGIAVMVMAMFFSTSLTNSSNDNLDLASLITLNVANAEDPDGDECFKRANYACYAPSTGNVIMHCDEDKWYTIANCY